MSEKTQGEELREKLFNNKKNGWESVSEEEGRNIFNYCDGYMKFLNEAKTEREIVKRATEIAKENGYKEISEYSTLKAGDKVYYINKGKNLFLAVIGEENIENGINIVGSHADSPRLDLKPNPVYEDHGFAYFKTHYYGGIKKYQWTTIPLSLHGVIVKANGEKINVNIGEDVKMKDLTDGVKDWADSIDSFDYAISREVRCHNNYELITKAGYNIENEAKELLKIYNS